MEHILFQYDCTNNINDSYTFLLCTANILYIDSQIAGIKITDDLFAYILPGFPKNMDYCFETTVVIVAGNVVVTSGVIRNGSIIWRKYLHFDSFHLTEVEPLDYIKRLEDKILFSIILNDLK